MIVIVLCSWNRMSTHVNDNAASCDQVFASLPNETYTLAIQLGDTLEADKYNSVFMGMMEQVAVAICYKIEVFKLNLSKLVVDLTDIFLLITGKHRFWAHIYLKMAIETDFLIFASVSSL